MYRVKLTARAWRELSKIRGRDAERIAGALEGLRENPRPTGARKLRGPLHRLRTGTRRIIYAVFDKDRLVLAGSIARRPKGGE